MDELKDKGKMLVENFGEKRHEFIQKWEEKSREFINSFIELFGPDGTLVNIIINLIAFLFTFFPFYLQNTIWNHSTGRIKRALSPSRSTSVLHDENNDNDEDNGDSDDEVEHSQPRKHKKRLRNCSSNSGLKMKSRSLNLGEYSDDEEQNLEHRNGAQESEYHRNGNNDLLTTRSNSCCKIKKK